MYYSSLKNKRKRGGDQLDSEGQINDDYIDCFNNQDSSTYKWRIGGEHRLYMYSLEKRLRLLRWQVGWMKMRYFISYGHYLTNNYKNKKMTKNHILCYIFFYFRKKNPIILIHISQLKLVFFDSWYFLFQTKWTKIYYMNYWKKN